MLTGCDACRLFRDILKKHLRFLLRGDILRGRRKPSPEIVKKDAFLPTTGRKIV